MVVEEKKFEGINLYSFDMYDDETFAIVKGDGYLDVYKNDSIVNSIDIYALYFIVACCHLDDVQICFCKTKNQINIDLEISCSHGGKYFSEGYNVCWSLDSNKEVIEDFYGSALSMVSSIDGHYSIFSSNESYYYENESKECYLLGIRNYENYTTNIIETNINKYKYTNLAFSNDSRFLAASRNNTNTFVLDIENWENKFTINTI